MDRASFPPELVKFVTNTESISTSGNPSKGECMDANLKEKNKESKVWQHGGMTALDWLRIFCNLGKLTSASLSAMLYFCNEVWILKSCAAFQELNVAFNSLLGVLPYSNFLLFEGL